MTGSTHLSTWISNEAKRRFAAAAARQSLSESALRSHLRQLAPLPDRELSNLQAAVREIAAVGRNLNTMTRLLQQDARQAVPGRQEVLVMLRICEALRDHVRALIRANLISWDIGHAEQSH